MRVLYRKNQLAQRESKSGEMNKAVKELLLKTEDRHDNVEKYHLQESKKTEIRGKGSDIISPQHVLANVHIGKSQMNLPCM